MVVGVCLSVVRTMSLWFVSLNGSVGVCLSVVRTMSLWSVHFKSSWNDTAWCPAWPLRTLMSMTMKTWVTVISSDTVHECLVWTVAGWVCRMWSKNRNKQRTNKRPKLNNRRSWKMVVNLCGWCCLFAEAELTRLTSEIAAVLWVGNKSVTLQACGSDRDGFFFDINVFVGEHLTLKHNVIVSLNSTLVTSSFSALTLDFDYLFMSVFSKVFKIPIHVLHPLLPPPSGPSQRYGLRPNRTLSQRTSHLVDCNFIIGRLLYQSVYWRT